MTDIHNEAYGCLPMVAIATLLCGVIALLYFTSQANAQMQGVPQCAASEVIKKAIKDTYGEKLLLSGYTGRGNKMVVYGTMGGTFTIGIENAQGTLMCLIMTGKALKDEATI